MLTYDLDKRGNKTMYEYLYELIKEDIADGKLKADEKLPSKRGLSQHLQISVKTVENAYEQLLLEGYIRSEEKRGYYVNKIAVVTGGAPGYAAPVKRFQEETYLADLTANNIRYDRFPFATWAKVMRETLTDYNTSLLKTVPFNGVLQLREAIADHLNRYRGMQVSADHIIIGAGTEYLYNRLLQLLGPDVKFGVENPGYRKITKIYDENGVDWDYVNIDDKGMKVDELKMKDINVAHVSPEHHFPIGLVMPVARRQELLNLYAQAFQGNTPSKLNIPKVASGGVYTGIQLPSSLCALTAHFHNHLNKLRHLFSVALSLKSPLPAVSRHPAL